MVKINRLSTRIILAYIVSTFDLCSLQLHTDHQASRQCVYLLNEWWSPQNGQRFDQMLANDSYLRGTFSTTGSAPGTPMSPGFPGGLSFPKPVEERVDPGQEFIRARQREAEEQKKRLLKAYDYISRQGAGNLLNSQSFCQIMASRSLTQTHMVLFF